MSIEYVSGVSDVGRNQRERDRGYLDGCEVEGCNRTFEEYLRVDGVLMCPVCAAKAWAAERELRAVAWRAADLLVYTMPACDAPPDDMRHIMIDVQRHFERLVHQVGMKRPIVVLPHGATLDSLSREEWDRVRALHDALWKPPTRFQMKDERAEEALDAAYRKAIGSMDEQREQLTKNALLNPCPECMQGPKTMRWVRTAGSQYEHLEATCDAGHEWTAATIWTGTVEECVEGVADRTAALLRRNQERRAMSAMNPLTILAPTGCKREDCRGNEFAKHGVARGYCPACREIIEKRARVAKETT